MYIQIRCNRNCFDCPICESVLLVMAGTDESNTAPQEQQAQIYFLFCGFCHWNSKSEIGMTFDKPVGIACMFLLND